MPRQFVQNKFVQEFVAVSLLKKKYYFIISHKVNMLKF